MKAQRRFDALVLAAVYAQALWALQVPLWFLWFSVDHDSADWVRRALGSSIITHCFGESGWRSHISEVDEILFLTGAPIGMLSVPIGDRSQGPCSRPPQHRTCDADARAQHRHFLP